MTLSAPTRPQQRQRCDNTVQAFNALSVAEKASFDLLDWFFTAGPGVSEPENEKNVSNMAAYYGRPVQEFLTFAWKTRATAELARLDDFAITNNLYNVEGNVEWNVTKWQLVMDRLAELV